MPSPTGQPDGESTVPRCATCFHHMRDPARPGFGECHKRAPLYMSDHGVAAWPLTDECDRCGEHKAIVFDAEGAPGLVHKQAAG